MREKTLNMGQGATNFMKERRNVNIGVRKVRCPHNFCQDCTFLFCRSVIASDSSGITVSRALFKDELHIVLSLAKILEYFPS